MICWGTGEAVKILLLKPGTLTSREMIQIYRIEQESRVWIPDRHWKMFVPHIIWFASLRLNLWCESLTIQSFSTFLKRSFCTSMPFFIIFITIDNQIYSKHGRKAGAERKLAIHVSCCASLISCSSRRTYRSRTCTLQKEKRWSCLLPSIPLKMWRTGCWKWRNPWRPVYGTTSKDQLVFIQR